MPRGVGVEAGKPRGRGAPGDLPAHPGHRPRGTPRASRRGRWRALVLVLVHVLLLVHLAHWKIAGRTLTPLEPSEAMQTLELGYVNAGFLLLGASLLATLLLGRFFCGWACHVVALQDGCAWLLGRVGLRPRPVRSRLLALVPLGAAFYMFAWPTLSRMLDGRAAPALRAHLSTEDLWATFPGPGIAVLTLLVDGFLIVWLLGAKGFCTYGCPYGALFGLAARAAPGRIRVTDACEGCGHCTAACTSNVQVHSEVARFGQVVDSGCMRCMDCVSVCPKDALYFGFGARAKDAAPAQRAKPKPKPKAKAKAPRRSYDFGWGEELALAAVFLAALYAWRGLYDSVPLLLAIGLAVTCAWAALVLWRLVRRSDVAVQGRALRAGRRWTAAGWTALALCGGLLALALHSGVVQVHAREGLRHLERAHLAEPQQRGPLLERSLEHLLAAERWGLVEVAGLQHKLGSIQRARGERAEAEARLRRATELDGELTAARLALADLLIVRGDLPGAERELRALLAVEPGHAAARARLERLALGAPAR